MYEQPTILIVDREADHLNQLISILEPMGYDIQIVTSGEAALLQLASSRPQLILCNVTLADMTGYDLCEQITTTHQNLPVILMSDANDVDVRTQTFRAGGVDYIYYPYHAEEVLARLHNHLNLNYLSTQVKEENELSQLLALAIQESGNAVIMTDRDGRIEWVNNGFTRMTEYTLDEIRGQDPGRVLGGEDTDPETARLMLNAIRAGQPCQVEILNYSKSGRPYWVEIHIQPVYQNGTLNKFIAIEIDITDRINSQEIQQEAESLRVALTKEHELRQLKSAFITMVSHEFRTPLAIIQAASETLQLYADKLTDDQRNKRLVKIRDQIGILTAIMNDVLIVNEIGTAPTVVDTTPLNPDDLCQEIIAKYVRIGIRQDIRFRSNNHNRHHPLNPSLMREIFEKLLSNAIAYSPEAEVIDVSILVEGKYLKITVEDYGIGIPELDQQQIFTEFYRASNVENIHGTGLGLSIVKYAVEAQGGSIHFESEEWVGSRFTVILPATSAKITPKSND